MILYTITTDMILDGFKYALFDFGLWKYLLICIVIGIIGMFIRVKLEKKIVDKQIDRQVERQYHHVQKLKAQQKSSPKKASRQPQTRKDHPK